MKLHEVREKYIKYFEDKGHSVVPSASLIPKNDPTTLFTGSGMQPLLPYLLGEEHPKGQRIVDSQKCFRSDDIDEVGNTRHTTCFEMLGNWSLGDYFKEEQLDWYFTFLTDVMLLDPKRLYVSVFIGDPKRNIPKDQVSADIWEKLFAKKGIQARIMEIGSVENGGKVGMNNGRIFYYDSSKNWWSRAGIPGKMPPGEPGGPDSEMFYEFTEIEHDIKYGDHCHPNCDCGRFLEIGNSVFMEYIKNGDGSFSKLAQKNVDFGGGLERLTAVTEGFRDIFCIDVYRNAIKKIEDITGVEYENSDDFTSKSFRILADHIKGATFLIGDGVKPSNLAQGYVVRRLIRRAIRFARLANIFEQNLCSEISKSFIGDYKDQYPELDFEMNTIISEINLEEKKFLSTLDSGIKEFNRISKRGISISALDAFNLFATHGFPIEMTKEMAEERGMSVDEEGYKREFAKHQEISRANIHEKKFAGGLESKDDPQVIKYHTTAHLMLAGLREVLGEHVHQKGSNITSERIRFDFSHDTKMTDEEKQKVEDFVNNAIKMALPVTLDEMSLNEAKDFGAEGEFTAKYGDKVKVYSIGDPSGAGQVVSREICGGPHVQNTSELGHFRIKKEESSSAGVRRIKAILE